MLPEDGWQPAVLDQFSNTEAWIDARERQLVKFYSRLGMRVDLNQKVPSANPEIARAVFGDIPAKGVHNILSGEAFAATKIGWTLFTKENPQGRIYVGVTRFADTAVLNLMRTDSKFAQEGKDTTTDWKPAIEILFSDDKAALNQYAEWLARMLNADRRLDKNSWRLHAFSRTQSAFIEEELSVVINRQI